jgi:hypothetical protein
LRTVAARAGDRVHCTLRGRFVRGCGRERCLVLSAALKHAHGDAARAATRTSSRCAALGPPSRRHLPDCSARGWRCGEGWGGRWPRPHVHRTLCA